MPHQFKTKGALEIQHCDLKTLMLARSGPLVAMQEVLLGDHRSIEKFGNNACTSMTDFKINRPGQRTLLGNHYIHPQSAARSALKAQ
jgi:hypothetical protein